MRKSIYLAVVLALGSAACVPDGPAGPGAFINGERAVPHPPAPEIPGPAPDPAPAPGPASEPGPGPAAPMVGTIEAFVSTDGTDTPDAVTVRLDDGAGRSVSAGGSTTWPDVSAGDRLVGVVDLPGNCDATGTNPRPVTVGAGERVVLSFDIACSAVGPAPGEIRVRVRTSGEEDEDEDGYRVQLDGPDGKRRQDVGHDADVTFPDLSPGSYEVELKDVDGDCEVRDDDKVKFELEEGERVDVEFHVECDD